jgi:DNA polymerase V
MRMMDEDEVRGLAHALVRRLPTGFPSPAEDSAEASLDLHALMVRNPAATIFVEMLGESMIGSGIFPHDVVVVDRSLTPVYGSVVLAAIDGEMVVRHFCREHAWVLLIADSEDFAPIRVPPGADLEIMGVVTYTSHRVNLAWR